MGSSAFKDLWIHGVTLIINLLTMAVGLFQARWFWTPCQSSASAWHPHCSPLICTSFACSQPGVRVPLDAVGRGAWVLHLSNSVQTRTVYLLKCLQVFTGAVIVSPLLVSIIWCLYNAIPPILLFTYAIAGRKYILSFMCGLAMVVSTACVIASLGFIWWIQVLFQFLPLEHHCWRHHVAVACCRAHAPAAG